MLVDQRHDFAGDGVSAWGVGFFQIGRGLERVAILLVVVPLAALRLAVGAHEHPEFLALRAIEVLHDRLVAPVHPLGKLGAGHQEMGVLMDFPGELGAVEGGFHLLPDPPIARFRTIQPVGF
jgi:hypothetical protein